MCQNRKFRQISAHRDRSSRTFGAGPGLQQPRKKKFGQIKVVEPSVQKQTSASEANTRKQTTMTRSNTTFGTGKIPTRRNTHHDRQSGEESFEVCCSKDASLVFVLAAFLHRPNQEFALTSLVCRNGQDHCIAQHRQAQGRRAF
jgi:hypothetical protein